MRRWVEKDGSSSSSSSNSLSSSNRDGHGGLMGKLGGARVEPGEGAPHHAEQWNEKYNAKPMGRDKQCQRLEQQV